MDITDILARFRGRYPNRLVTVDSHTAGEVNRIIVGGVEPLPGADLVDQRQYLIDKADHYRRILCSEPRGGQDLLAALVTEPLRPEADFGLIYMDAKRYPYGCGTATIGAVTTLLEADYLTERGPEIEVVVDTPAGPARTVARLDGDRVESVALRFAPSFVHQTDLDLDVPGLGKIKVDTVCASGFFVMVSADQIGLELTTDNAGQLSNLGMTIIDQANRQLTVAHPERPEVTTIDVVEFYDPAGHDQGQGLSAVVFGEGHLDRSPCGTGTTAKLTLLHHRGRIGLDEPFTNHSPIGTTFQARIVGQTAVGDRPAVEVEVRGAAHVTGLHEFVIDPHDPFPQGFLV